MSKAAVPTEERMTFVNYGWFLANYTTIYYSKLIHYAQYLIQMKKCTKSFSETFGKTSISQIFRDLQFLLENLFRRALVLTYDWGKNLS